MHTLAAQLAVAFARAAQAFPQRPQCASVVARFTSQPSAAVVLQSPKPVLQVNVQALSVPQRGIAAFTGAAQGSLCVASPSVLHTVRAVPPAAQVEVPGAQTHPLHIVPVQVDDVGHGKLIALVPSALHTRTVRASTHIELEGVHARSTQLPLAQRCDAPHATVIAPKPSALHTLRAVADAHVLAPGMHVCATHAPSRQPSPNAQGTVDVDSPSAAHTLRAVADTQVLAPGTHVRAAHSPARHDCPSGQGEAV